LPKIWKLSPNFQNHEMAGWWGGGWTMLPIAHSFQHNFVLIQIWLTYVEMAWRGFLEKYTQNIYNIFMKLVDSLGVIFWNGTSMDLKLKIDLKLSSYMEYLKFIKHPFIFIIFTSKNDKVQIFTSARNKLKNEEIWRGLLGDINYLHSIKSNGSKNL